MPISESLQDRVRSALAGVPRVEEKKMFGSLAFMVRGKMCVAAREERIMCRIDPSLHDRALERDGCQAMEMNGRVYRGFMRVSADALKSKRDLDYWIGLALDYNARAKASKRRKRTTRSPKSHRPAAKAKRPRVRRSAPPASSARGLKRSKG
jgi:TfoX/Sxy family transcriptional regulator of competence genes